MNLRPSGYEPDEMSGFLRVLRRVANVSQINFAYAVVSQMYRKSASIRYLPTLLIAILCDSENVFPASINRLMSAICFAV